MLRGGGGTEEQRGASEGGKELPEKGVQQYFPIILETGASSKPHWMAETKVGFILENNL